MRKAPFQSEPPDLVQRERALDPARSVLVCAPAGSGKTTLLAERFLRLLAEVEQPGEVVAITFTNAAAAEMRHRILDELAASDPGPLARRVLEHSQALGWNLLELPAQLRISTIDSFCRELALLQPLLSNLGGALDIFEAPEELYRRAARRTLEEIGSGNSDLTAAIERLLLWRDNNWQETEDLLVNMLKDRDRWMHDFLLNRDPDWHALRTRLERPFGRAYSNDASPLRYTDGEWSIIRACFLLLRRAAGHLQVVFAETGAVDFTEVAQIALRVLRDEDGLSTDAALAVADGIRHLLVDEFQDTSRKQHRLLASLIAAWPEREGRTCFVVGDPMQSIYFFRDADAELFPRVEKFGLDLPGELPLIFDSVALTANFRTAPSLVNTLNEIFRQVFEADDGSGVPFTAAEPARQAAGALELPLRAASGPRLDLHVEFMPDIPRTGSDAEKDGIKQERAAAHDRQVGEIVELIRPHLQPMNEARAENLRIGNQNEKRKYRIAVLGRARTALAPVAGALRAAGIPFRAVELEPLKDRPEVLDALALARALLNPQDRVAWLGVLRAPWCALMLENLHRLVSADDEALLARAVPDLLAERLSRLSAEPRAAVERILAAFAWAQHLRAVQPSAALGAWVEQAWLALGGAHCVDAAGRANLDLLWRALDVLPAGEQDLLGPALDAALEKLTALPDPDADENCGVQLMTIHKAKGLEFEIVIVPELQAVPRHNEPKLLSWLERGVAEPDKSGEPTEFLVAPIAAKGADRSSAREWVDRVRRERERQELRRLLYVAASRAREQLHFFTRPAYKTAKDGSLTLAEPRESLLSTAWPALQTEIRERFRAWRAPAAPVVALAAAAEDTEPSASTPHGTLLRRLPHGVTASMAEAAAPASAPAIAGMGRLYQRHEGGLRSRALGVAVHALLEETTRLRASLEWDAVRAALPGFSSRVAAPMRSAGIDPAETVRMAAQAEEIALKATHDPIGAWILSPHRDAQSEIRWTGVAHGSLRTVQVDRVFRAGAEPQSQGDNTWWIVDYKTAHEAAGSPEDTLLKLRKEFAPQLEAYAQFLRNLHGADAPVRAGLYYPRFPAFDWWEI